MRTAPALVALLLVLAVGIRADQADIDALPSVISTEDVLDWVLKWTGSELYPSEIGPPGWPGRDNELRGEAGYRDINWGYPEVVPYPGSIEHVRYNFQRYLPAFPPWNKHTLVKRFLGSDIAGVDAERLVEYPEPVYHVPKYRYLRPAQNIWSDAIKLGKYRRPITVLRFDATHPALTFELGELRAGAYIVRIVAATESELVEHCTKRLVINFSVNDGLKGEVNSYKKRCGANDQFYSIGEFDLFAPEARQYTISISVDASSELPLYLYTVDVHDRLRQVANRAGKVSPSYYQPDERLGKWAETGPVARDTRSREQRFADDEMLWRSMPQMNAQPRGAQSQWDGVTRAFVRLPQDKTDDGMGIDLYGSDMIWNIPEKEYEGHRAAALFRQATLTGLYFNLQRQSYFGEAAKIDSQMAAVRSLGNADRNSRAPAAVGYRKFLATGAEVEARRTAVRLAMVALLNIFEMDDVRNTMTCIDMIPWISMHFLQDRAFRRRSRENKGHPAQFLKIYDDLFPYIKDNTDLAESLARFIPWIKNPEDLRRFYEVGLAQVPALELLSYRRYDNGNCTQFMSACIVNQQDVRITRPWMEWLFRYVWTYPNIPMGVDESFFTTKTRDGTSIIGSTFYTFAYIHAIRNTVRDLKILNPEHYKGIIEEDITLPEAHVRAEMEAQFERASLFAGGHRIAIGDVSGATPARWWLSPDEVAGKDPRNRSRVLSSWFGALETGLEQEDFRKRSAIALRVGCGYGHAHEDPLDLQIWSMGVPLCGDWGGRGGYAQPSSLSLEAHNTVVNYRLRSDHRWIASMADTTAARYIMGRADSAGFYGRQVALIDVDDADAGVYVVDVFRLQGQPGDKIPAYAFHGPPMDEFYTNIEEVRPGYPEDDGPIFDLEHNWHGTIAGQFTADWRLQRGAKTFEWTPSEKQQQSAHFMFKKGAKQSLEVSCQESKVLGGEFDPAAPHKHIRMHLLGHEGATAYGRRGYMLHAWKFVNDMVFVRPRSWETGEAVFPVVFEPYGAQTRIRSLRLLSDAAGVDSHTSPMAIEIRLRNGRRDIVCMAPRDTAAYEVPGVGTVQGEYAYLSYDEQGLRQATLVGGTTVTTEDLVISSPRAAWQGNITGFDMVARTIELDAPMPPECAGAVVEIGNRTSYTVTAVDGTRITTKTDFVAGMSRIKGFLEDGNPYTNAVLSHVPGLAVTTGDLSTYWTVGEPYELVPDEKAWWRGGNAHPAEIGPRGRAVPLLASALTPAEHMKPGGRLWLLEFAPGSLVRLPVRVNLMRHEDGTYRAAGNVDATIRVRGTAVPVERGTYLDKSGRAAIRADAVPASALEADASRAVEAEDVP